MLSSSLTNHDPRAHSRAKHRSAPLHWRLTTSPSTTATTKSSSSSSVTGAGCHPQHSTKDTLGNNNDNEQTSPITKTANEASVGSGTATSAGAAPSATQGYLNEPFNHLALDSFCQEVSPAVQSSFASCLISPVPNVSFSPIVKDESLIPLLRTLYELHETEIAYVDALKVLSSTYLGDIYAGMPTNEAVPITVLKQLLEQMLTAHSAIAKGLWDILSSNTLSVAQMTVLAARLVASNSETSFYYEEYCNNYGFAMSILTDNQTSFPGTSVTNDEVLTALRNYLELVQPVARKGDLSLESLALRPLMRIPKYRLLLELMERRLNNENARPAVHYYVEKVKATLRRINDSGNERSGTMGLNLDLGSFFGRDRLVGNSKRTLDFFGIPQLVGALTVVWIEGQTNVKYRDMACFIFKSHLLCCELHLFSMLRRRKKLKVRFLIPFSRCKLYSNTKDNGNGLYTTYPYTLKIVLESKLLHYEVMLVCLTQRDHQVWAQHLSTFINEVNGPYKLDFSIQDSVPTTLIPNGIIPSDLCLEDDDTYQKHKFLCYFGLPVSVAVVLGFYNIDKVPDPIFAGYYNLANDLDLHKEGRSIFIRLAPRETLERALWNHWSKELPRYFARSIENNRVHKNECEYAAASSPEPSSVYSDSLLASAEVLSTGMKISETSIELELLAKANVGPSLIKLHTL